MARSLVGGRMNIKRDPTTIIDDSEPTPTLGGSYKRKKSKTRNRSRKNKRSRTMKRNRK
jgi:hypothetical protein